MVGAVMELWQLVKLVSERYGKRLQEHKKTTPGGKALEALTIQQFQYLQAINNLPAATVGGLSLYFGVTSPTATFTVNKLVRDGYLEKKPSSEDSRSNFLLLTSKGQKLLKVQEEAFKALASDIENALTKKELEAYFDLTKKVCDSL